MSDKARYWLDQQERGISALARSIVNAYAGFADDDYTAHVSISKLHQRTFIRDYRTLKANLAEAVEAGYLVDTGRKVRGTPVYQMLCPPGAVVAYERDGMTAHRPPTLEEYLAGGGFVPRDVDNYDGDCKFTVVGDECGSDAPCEFTVPVTRNLQCPTPCEFTVPITGDLQVQEREKENLDKGEIDMGGSAAATASPPHIPEPAPFKSMREQAIERLKRVGVDSGVAAQLLAARGSDRFTEVDAKTLAGEARKAGIETTLAALWAIRNGAFTAAAYRENPGMQEGGAQEPEASPKGDELEMLEDLTGGWNPAMHEAAPHGGLAHVH